MTRTFLGRGDFLHFSAAVPPGLGDRRPPEGSDPWEDLGYALANLQKGNFDVAAVPIDLMKRHDDLNLWIACANLVGFAVPIRIVKSLFEQFSSPVFDSRKRYLCSAAVDAGGLWVVDHILALLLGGKNADERRYLVFELSWLLEEEDGWLWAGPELLEVPDPTRPPYIEPELKPDIEGYVKMAKERAGVLGQAGVNNGQVAEGKLVNIEESAERLLARLTSGDRSYRIDRGRMLLEATTGLDCRGFFNKHAILQPLAATAIVEEFLESAETPKYENGVRYFFGHRIPD